MLPQMDMGDARRYGIGSERRRGERRRELAKTLRITLIRKLAEWLDGIDLSAYDVGDVFDLPRREADLLIREGWAVPFIGNGPTATTLRGTHAMNNPV